MLEAAGLRPADRPKLKKEYDVVVVDSPPMGAVTDGLLIAERTDEVIYVCRFNRAYRKHIKLYIRALLNGKNAVLGHRAERALSAPDRILFGTTGTTAATRNTYGSQS